LIIRDFTEYTCDIDIAIPNSVTPPTPKGPHNADPGGIRIHDQASLTWLEAGIPSLPVDNLPLLSHTFTLADIIILILLLKSLSTTPHSLLKLKIFGKFNHPIDHLPPSLTHLTIGGSFNKPINHLPPSLLFLDIMGSFNQTVDHLPSLIHLSLEGEFDQPMDRLPSSLSNLRLISLFTHSLYHLPHSLETLVVRHKLLRAKGVSLDKIFDSTLVFSEQTMNKKDLAMLVDLHFSSLFGTHNFYILYKFLLYITISIFCFINFASLITFPYTYLKTCFLVADSKCANFNSMRKEKRKKGTLK
jgi:hypothetical protein